jgi:glycosyltransferase involved in cell wall biosynthesis
MEGKGYRGRVSVVIPTFNRAKFLPDAIRSALCQTYRDLDVVVVDDGSTDDTPEVVGCLDDERVAYIRIDRCHSPARARNVGVSRATGRFIAFLDSDDVWLPEKIERQIEALRASPECRWSYTRFDHIDENGAPMAPLRGGVGTPRSGWILEHMVTEDALVMVQSVLVEASLLDEVGGFDESPALREDLDLCFRLAGRSQVVALEANLLRVRHHAARTTFGLPEVTDWRVHALRKLLGSTTDRRLRRLCRRQCARELAELAGAYESSGRRVAAVAVLARALEYDPFQRLPWTNLAKTLARPLMTQRMMDAYRRTRDMRAGRVKP